MKTVDARKMDCPKPVIMTKDALATGEKEVTIIVDNNTAKNNVVKYMKKQSCEPVVEEKDGDFYISTFISDAVKGDNADESNDVVRGYFIGTNKLGAGNDELGKFLMKGFVYSLTESKPYPNFILLVNEGVTLACKGSDSLDDLRTLMDAGVNITACGTCLDFLNLKSELQLGEVGNMYDIVDTMNGADKVITLG